MKILITGGCGTCGSALTALEHDKVFLDSAERIEALRDERFIQGDINDPKTLLEAMQGCDVVIHLAIVWPCETVSKLEAMDQNAKFTQKVLSMAAYLKVKRIVYASSIDVVGMVEVENAPHIYEPGHDIIVDRSAEIRPDSEYGVGKAFEEHFGRFYAEHGGAKFYAIRMGSVQKAEMDHPFAYAQTKVEQGGWGENSDEYWMAVKRSKAVWQSRRDFVQMIDLCLNYDGPVFDIFYGVSDNSRRWLDIEYAKDKLGYRPLDNGEDWSVPPEKKEKMLEKRA